MKVTFMVYLEQINESLRLRNDLSLHHFPQPNIPDCHLLSSLPKEIGKTRSQFSKFWKIHSQTICSKLGTNQIPPTQHKDAAMKGFLWERQECRRS